MKKKLFILFSIVLATLSFCSCKKKEQPKVYSGSVMVYTTFDANTISTIKKDFENTYKGVVLDYFYGDISSITEKINMSFMLELPEADILLIDDKSALQTFKNNSYLKSYTSIEDKKVQDEYKDGNNGYYTAVLDGNKKYYVVSVSNGLNAENSDLFIDYILSKKTQEMLVNNGLKTVRNDIK